MADMEISWGTIKSLAIFFAPMLIPRAIAWYRSADATPKERIRPLPALTVAAIVVLTFAAALFAISTLPAFSPENVFTITGSNPTASNSLILSRLAALRPLTPKDDILRDKFESKASKLLYYKYGPSVLVDCPFCTSQEPNTYLFYALPAVAAVHLANVALVGLATSENVTGRAGGQWRALATYVALGLAFMDLYTLIQWDHVARNENARMLSEVVFFHWRSRALRHLRLAAVDLVLAVALYLSGTNRMFGVPTTTTERVGAVTASLNRARARLQAAGIIKNTTARDGELRAAEARYWAFEVVTSQEAMESEDVVRSMRDALENRRLDMDAIEKDAETYARNVLQQAMLD